MTDMKLAMVHMGKVIYISRITKISRVLVLFVDDIIMYGDENLME